MPSREIKNEALEPVSAPAPAGKTVIGKDLKRLFGWNRFSSYWMGAFLIILFLIGYVWWPLLLEYVETYNPAYPFWMQIDWLLIGVFLVMSGLLMAHANAGRDIPMFFIALFGGLVIESWGTQTELWTYYTFERPPLWIIPAWPIASLSIDRLYRLFKYLLAKLPERIFKVGYVFLFGVFLYLLIPFIWHTRTQSMTMMALVLCLFLIATPVNPRGAVLTFLAGSGLGYFLELWGTTRLCWTYYSLQTPPVFAVFAHGMAAVAFWRVLLLYQILLTRFQEHNKRALSESVAD